MHITKILIETINNKHNKHNEHNEHNEYTVNKILFNN
jgi:hypothetical protein